MQLLAAHRAGDPAAIAELLSDYQRRIHAVCFRMTRDAEDAADLTQESLLKVMDGLESYGGRSAFSTWVIRVTMNCCLSHLRRERVRRHRSLDEAAGPGETPRGLTVPDPRELSGPERVERSEMRPVLLRALEGLEPDMRAVLVLRDIQDLDYQQIGAVLDLPLGTVKSRLYRARAALRSAAEAGPGDEDDHA